MVFFEGLSAACAERWSRQARGQAKLFVTGLCASTFSSFSCFFLPLGGTLARAAAVTCCKSIIIVCIDTVSACNIYHYDKSIWYL